MKKWPLAVMAVAVLLVGLFVGRVTAPDQGIARTASAHDPAAEGSTWERVQSSGTVIVGIGQEAAPFGYRQDGELVGFDVDIARAVAEQLSAQAGRAIELDFQAVTDETRITWVQSGQVDMSLAHTNITRKRLENIDFSVPYGWDGKGVLYRAADGTQDLSSFAGKSVGIKRSSSSEGEIKAYFAAQGWDPPVLRQFDNHAAGIQALMDGQIDGFTDDNSIVINTAVVSGFEVGPDRVLRVTDTPYSPTYFGIGIRKNDSHWRDMVNYSLHDLWQSGEYERIYQRWFGPESACPIPLGNHRMEPFVSG
jgi:polar amino acid transport system substrate-binding protein